MEDKIINLLITEIEKHSEPFVAILMNNQGDVVAKGVNQYSQNPLFHSEIDAINNFINKSGITNLIDHTLYTTAEPCPMCQSAIFWSKVGKVYYNVSRQTLFELGWTQTRVTARQIRDFFEPNCSQIFGPFYEDHFIDYFKARANNVL